MLTCPHCGSVIEPEALSAACNSTEDLLRLEAALQVCLSHVHGQIRAKLETPQVVDAGDYRVTWRKAKTRQFQGWTFQRALKGDPDIGPLIDEHTKEVEKEFFNVEFRGGAHG